MGQDHQRTEEHRSQARQHDAQVDGRQARTVHLGSADDRLIDAAQTGQEQRHDEARGLPYGSDHQAVDDPVRIDQPVEAKAFPAPVTQQLVQTQAGIEQPLPGGTGDDHRQCHGVQVDGADQPLAADALVQQHGEHDTDDQADGDEQAAEHQQVLAGHPPAVVVPQALVLLQTDPLVAGHEARVGERQQEGPADVGVEADQHDQHARRQDQLGQPALQGIERRDLGGPGGKRDGAHGGDPSSESGMSSPAARALACTGTTVREIGRTRSALGVTARPGSPPPAAWPPFADRPWGR